MRTLTLPSASAVLSARNNLRQTKFRSAARRAGGSAAVGRSRRDLLHLRQGAPQRPGQRQGGRLPGDPTACGRRGRLQPAAKHSGGARRLLLACRG